MRRLLTVLLALAIAPAAAVAQATPPGASPADRLLAVNAVARFRLQMLQDSTKIDACSLRLLVGPALAGSVEARTRPLYVSGTEPNGVCERLGALAANRSRRLLLESVSAAGDSLVLRAAFVHGELTHAEEYVVRRAAAPYVVSQRLSEFIVAAPAPPPR